MKEWSKNKLNINKYICFITMTFLVIFFLCGIKLSSNKYTVDTYVESKLSYTEMSATEAAEHFSGFWQDTYESNIQPSNEKFYRRFNRAYSSWFRRASTEDDAAVLEASKPHLLTALFLDYSPDNFNDNIAEWAAGGNLDNIFLNQEDYAYQVCDNAGENDENCGSNNPDDNDYSSNNIYQAILNLIEGAILKVQKYLDDRDTIRALGRHLFVYQPVCHITRELDNGEIETIDYKYSKKYTFNEVLELLSQGELFRVYSAFPEYVDCAASDSHWLNESNVVGTSFDLYDIVDLCAFYRHLVESDYFENHVHFVSDFEAIRNYAKTDQEYLVESSKLKVGLAREIISIVDLSNDDDPVYDTSVTTASGIYGNYSLSEDLYITVANTRIDDNNGHEIINASYPIDQYVEGVLDAEVLGAFYGSGEDENDIYTALQANAVAIRTYALKVTEEGTKSITNGTSAQVFTDEYLDNEGLKYLAARNAALSTSGQVLTENGNLILSEYSSFSKNTDYRCEAGLCYTTYLKIGAKNTGTAHTVVAKSNWNLAGGHNKGMSQWGSLYLAINGYPYKTILENFYAENVVVSNYDYSYKSTDTVSLGEEGGKEAMLICDLFTSDEDAALREALGDLYTTLEIPLRLTSTKYQSSHGYNALSDSNGLWFNRYDGVHGQIYKCEWNPETTALIYACYDNVHGYIIGEENYLKDDGGNYLDIKGEVTTDPNERVLLDVSQTRTDVYLPNAIVWQWAINLINKNIPSEGGWTAHGYYEASAGFYPSYVFGNLPSSLVYKASTNSDGTVQTTTSQGDAIPCKAGYTEKNGYCCLIKGEEQCYEKTYKAITSINFNSTAESSSSPNYYRSSRYDRMLDGSWEEMNMEDVLYTGFTTEEVIAFYEDESNIWKADHIDTYLYAYYDDVNEMSPELLPYASPTAENIIQSNGSYGNLLRDADIKIVKATAASDTGVYVNITEFLEDNGFVNIGGVASKSYSSVESHHWQIACEYYVTEDPTQMWLTNLADNYCCSGLFEGFENQKHTYSYDDYSDNMSYLEVSQALGGYFSDAWKIEFCTNTLEGRSIVQQACNIALTTQESCYEGCYIVADKDYEGKVYYSSSGITYQADDNGNPIIDYDAMAIDCYFDITQFGGSGYSYRELSSDESSDLYKKYNNTLGSINTDYKYNMTTGLYSVRVELPTLRKIPHYIDAGRDVGGCSCEILNKGLDNATKE